MKLLIVGFLFVFLFSGISTAFAATIPYTITTGITSKPAGSNPFYSTQFQINYQSGRMFLSSNPDGTGNTQVDDVLHMIITRPNGTTFFFDHFYPTQTCSSLNFLVPSELLNAFLPGINTVSISLNNACGTLVGSSPLYLVNINAPDPTPAPTPTSTPTPTPTPTPTNTPLILIPGIGGSELKVAEDTLWNKDDGHGGIFNHGYSKDEKVWVNENEAASLGDDDYFDVLRMKSDGIAPEANLALTNNIVARAYQETLDFFTTNGYTLNQDLFVFPYDWRQDLSITKTELENKINQIKNQTGSNKVDIVAHSMGGLVARNYIADSVKAQNVRKLFTLGTSHLGSPKFLEAIRYGYCLLLKIGPACLSVAPSEMKDVIQNMIGGFELAPSQTYFNIYSGQDNSHPTPYADLRDIDNNGITGALNYDQTKTLLTNLGHNTSLFTQSEAFHNLDNNLSNNNGVEVTNIVGSGIATLGQIIEKNTFDLLGIKIPHKDEFMINGDNTVPLLSASFGSANSYYTKQEHGNLAFNGPALNLVKNILNGNPQLPNGVSTQAYEFTGHGLSVHSPVNIHVHDSNGNHTGPLANGDFEANIPGSFYDTLDDNKFIWLPDDGVYTINFEATDQGSFDFKIRNYQNSENTNTILYNNIPITPISTGEATFDTAAPPPNLIVDQQTINPDDILTGNANYDQTPPIILVNTPIENGVYILNQNAQNDYSCTDDNSGIDFCNGSKPTGNNLDTNSIGDQTFNIDASDKAGNIASKTIHYKVRYATTGTCLGNPVHAILQPINTDGTSVFKQGSTVPAKFRICDNGISIGSSDLVKSFNLIKTISGTIISNVNESVNSTNPESNFRWDPTNQQWIFNMSTKGLTAGKTYFYKILLNDLSTIEFSFGLR